ncbi:glycosyltransferase family 2 protein [Acetivibrio straminisolvens]|uniref:Glycosyltransferase n=1 Tax=Acetivibrio straminisolvens JCM 21531 TaxID=1294263 RepID=W4VB23_9FIRM|nr:glycosyltransferase [Acetivibrio straminisolvens]GAE89929.1 glycosyltransferase [Acetivibrio straminisolvens JCM 21531]
MDKIKISIIVPVYNGDQFVEACCEQLQRQTLKEIEIIFINDGSIDNTGNICDQLVKKYNNCRVFHQENKGVSAARNLGINMATGEYVGFVDVDDQYDNDMFEVLYTLAKKYDADIACLDKVGPQNQTTVWYNNIDAIRELLKGNISISSCNKIYRRSLYPDFCFPEGIKIYEDCHTVYNALKLSKCIVCQHVQKYHYIHRENSSSRVPFEKKLFDAIDVIDTIYEDINNNYPMLREEAEAKKANVYLRISKIYYLRGKPKEHLPRILSMKKYLSSLSGSQIHSYMKIKNRIRYYLYIFCFPLFYILTKSIDRQ